MGADPATHVAPFPRNTTEALNMLASRLGLTRDDVVVTTAVEHHSNLLPWRRAARLRVVDVDRRGTFDLAAVEAALDSRPAPRALAVTGASNGTGWLPDLRSIAAAAHERGVLVVVDGAQLVPHRPVDMAALGIDGLAFSGHGMHAPFGAGALVVPRRLLAQGEPFLVGGGTVKPEEERRFHEDARADRYDRLPGAVRVSCNATTSLADVAALGEALRTIAATPERARLYRQRGDGHVVPVVPAPRTPA